MPVYNYNGTNFGDIGKLHFFDGANIHQIGKVYGYDGTANSLIYSAELVPFDGSSGGAGSGVTWTQDTSKTRYGSGGYFFEFWPNGTSYGTTAVISNTQLKVINAAIGTEGGNYLGICGRIYSSQFDTTGYTKCFVNYTSYRNGSSNAGVGFSLTNGTAVEAITLGSSGTAEYNITGNPSTQISFFVSGTYPAGASGSYLNISKIWFA